MDPFLGATLSAFIWLPPIMQRVNYLDIAKAPPIYAEIDHHTARVRTGCGVCRERSRVDND